MANILCNMSQPLNYHIKMLLPLTSKPHLIISKTISSRLLFLVSLFSISSSLSRFLRTQPQPQSLGLGLYSYCYSVLALLLHFVVLFGDVETCTFTRRYIELVAFHSFLAETRGGATQWLGGAPALANFFFFHQSRLKKNQGPPNIGQLAPPCPILNYSPKSNLNILLSPALVLGLITFCTPNKTSQPAQVQTLKTKLHFLFISKFHPLTHEIPFFTSYSFVLSSLIHFHLHWYCCLPTNPQNSSPLYSQSEIK